MVALNATEVDSPAVLRDIALSRCDLSCPDGLSPSRSAASGRGSAPRCGSSPLPAHRARGAIRTFAGRLTVRLEPGRDIVDLLALEEQLSDLFTFDVDVIADDSTGAVIGHARREAVPL